jgi:hypothetical protein
MVALTILLIRTHYTTLLLLHLIMNLHIDKLFLLCSLTIMPTQTNNMCEQAIISFPLDKILEPIPWNDHNFNVVVEAMPGCDMRKLVDIVLLKWSKRRKLHCLFQNLN